jgi:uncharacterized repeat protein (TIGR02543 family)
MGLPGYEVSGRLRISHDEGGIGVTIFSQMPSSLAYYRLRRFGENGSFQVSPVGTTVTGSTDTGVVPSNLDWYRFRLQAEDVGGRTEIRAMVWEDGQPEPASWQVEVYDDSPTRLVSGTFGLWTFDSGFKYADELALRSLAPPRTDLVLTTNISGMGDVLVTPDQPTYTLGEWVTIEAIPDAGHVFTGWSGDLSGTTNPLDFIITGDTTVTADFLEDLPRTLTLVEVGDGTAAATPPGPDFATGEVVELLATSGPGSLFVGWTGDVDSGDSPLTITMLSDVLAVANFNTPSVELDFESLAPGDDPADWMDTDASNSLVENDALFDVQTVSGTQALGTTSTATNIHSHYIGGEAEPLLSYEISGRMQIEQAAGGIGVTAFSEFPIAAAYYRLRRFDGTDFHLSPLGTSLEGDLDTGVVPTAGVWYRFRLRIEDDGNATLVQAKVWQDGQAEPADWQADASDASPGRLTAGTFGVWSMGSGAKYWDDLALTSLAPSEVPNFVVPALSPHWIGLLAAAIAGVALRLNRSAWPRRP